MKGAFGMGRRNGAFGTGHTSGLDADGGAEHMTSRDAVDPDLCHLLARAAAVERRIRHAVELRRSTDPDPDDDFRGLYLTDENIVRLLDEAGARGFPALEEPLAGGESSAAPAEVETGSRLAVLAREFGLTALDAEILLIALVPDLDDRFEAFYGYLNDDVSRRRPSIGMALGLCGVALSDPAARARLAAGAPLRAGGLLLAEDLNRPFLSRALRVPDRVAAHLLGDDTPDPRLADLLAPWQAVPGVGDPVPLAGVLADGIRLAYLSEDQGGAGTALAASALTRAGRGVLGLDLARLAEDPSPAEAVNALVREARLTGAGLVCAPLDAVSRERPGLLRPHGHPGPDGPGGPGALGRVLVGRPAPAAARAPGGAVGARGAVAGRVPAPGGCAASARHRPGPPAGPVPPHPGTDHRSRPLRRPGGPAGGRRAHRGPRTAGGPRPERGGPGPPGPPHRTCGDLGRPGPPVGHPHPAPRTHGPRTAPRPGAGGVGDAAWRGPGPGVSALFAGDSGTGKTMSAEVIAADLGLDLYTVDLATVIDKYVGETEKNLERIFTEAAGVNGVLLFDEADAIFGKRSDVKDAHDRYANVESAYLLQRMESFDGLAILATNLRANLDDAFTRRLDLVIDFPVPDPEQRLLLWDRCLGRTLPRGTDLDLPFCAENFELAGGNIRSIAVTAAYLAADTGGAVTMETVIHAIQREYQKLGRLTLASEFGPYLGLVT